MIEVFLKTEHETRVFIGGINRPEAGSDEPPTLLLEIGDEVVPVFCVQSFERWPRIMVEIIRKLAEGRGDTASHILDEMDAAIFDGDGKLRP